MFPTLAAHLRKPRLRRTTRASVARPAAGRAIAASEGVRSYTSVSKSPVS